MNKKALVVDLDGTLYAINTFHHFIKHLFLYCFKAIDISLFTRLVSVLFLRAISAVDHSEMKYSILKAIHGKTNIDCQKFVQNISGYRNNISQINDTRYELRILATAAPSQYAEIIAQSEGFNVCLSTKYKNTKLSLEFENVKEIKRNNVQAYLNNLGIYEIDTLITDHHDDMPLMQLSRNNLLVNPSNETIKKVATCGIPFEIIRL